MTRILGIDTSNYTTSCALWQDGVILQKKKLLPVRPGQLGLRQSDAVFHHTQQLPELLEELFRESPGPFSAIGVSTRPRSQDGSYMPCFTVGHGTARSLAAAFGVPCRIFSHQDGHIAAALYSGDRLDWIGKEFLAFHVSGGTTEAVLVRPHAEGGFSADLLASSLDLKAGQAIDRVGVMLGLPFPAGRALEELALRSSASFRIRPSMKGASCSLSGIENKCRNMVERGTPPEDIALFCLLSVEAALDAMAAALLQERPGLPLLFAGGVMSNSILRRDLTKKYGATFAEPAFSSDNAAGVAVLAALAEQKGGTA